MRTTEHAPRGPFHILERRHGLAEIAVGGNGVQVERHRVIHLHHMALYMDDAAALEDLREAVTTLEETEPTARRVFGGAHPLAKQIEAGLLEARAALRARDTAPPGSA